MTENIDPRTDPAYKALVEVINAIAGNKVPLMQPHEMAARSTLRALQIEIDDLNVLDNSDLIDTLNQTRIEIKYLVSRITDLQQALIARESDVAFQRKVVEFWESSTATWQIAYENSQSEIKRLENLVSRAN